MGVRTCVYSAFLNNLKGDPLEIQQPKFENSRLGLIESVHDVN